MSNINSPLKLSSSILSYKKFLLITIAWWILWIFEHAIVLQKLDYSWRDAFTDSLISNAWLMICCLIAGNTLRFYQPSRSNVLYLLLWSFVLAGIWCAGTNWMLNKVFDDSYTTFINESIPVRFCIAFLMIGCAMSLSWIVRIVKTQQEQDQRKSDAEKLAREAELTGLRQQLQPHFLFNSLNSISAMVVSKPEEARKMIQQLSDFLRGTLKKDEQLMISLADELKHLQLYLDIEKVRFGHRLITLVKTDKKIADLQLPALLLQPIVENAIKFGLYDNTGEVTITINSFKEGNELIISIENPFDPHTSQPRQGTGFGLSSVQRRLYLLFGRNDLLKTESQENKFITTIKIPQS